MVQKTGRKHWYVSLLKLGVPIMIGQLGIIVVGFADNIMVGHYGTDELSAASFVNNLFNLVILFGLGFSLGLTPVIGQLMSRNQAVKAGQTLRCSLAINLVLALVLSLFMLLVYFNVERMKQPDHLMPLIKPYFLIHLLGLCFVMLFNAFKQFADGLMDTRTPMYILLSSNIINIIGNYVLIFGHFGFPELGLVGAGLSTLCARIFTVVVFAGVFLFSKRYDRFRAGFFRLKTSWEDRCRLIRLGLPIACQMGMETGAFNLSVVMMGWVGATALAAHQVVGTFTTIGFMLYYGVGSAITILISNHKSENNVTQIRDITRSGAIIITVISVVIVVVMGLLRNRIGYMFTDSAEVNALVAWLVLPTMAYQISDGLQIAYANALRGIEDVKPMAVIAFISYFVVCLPISYLFGFVFDWEASGVWWGFPIGLTVAASLFYFRFRYMTRKMLKQQKV